MSFEETRGKGGQDLEGQGGQGGKSLDSETLEMIIEGGAPIGGLRV